MVPFSSQESPVYGLPLDDASIDPDIPSAQPNPPIDVPEESDIERVTRESLADPEESDVERAKRESLADPEASEVERAMRESLATLGDAPPIPAAPPSPMMHDDDDVKIRSILNGAASSGGPALSPREARTLVDELLASRDRDLADSTAGDECHVADEGGGKPVRKLRKKRKSITAAVVEDSVLDGGADDSKYHDMIGGHGQDSGGTEEVKPRKRIRRSVAASAPAVTTIYDTFCGERKHKLKKEYATNATPQTTAPPTDDDGEWPTHDDEEWPTLPTSASPTEDAAAHVSPRRRKRKRRRVTNSSEAASEPSLVTPSAEVEAETEFTAGSHLSPDRPLCSKCMLPLEVEKKFQLTGKGLGRFKCHTCNTRGVQISRRAL